MKNAKRYSQMLLTVVMLVVAGYAGAVSADMVHVSYSDAGPCSANYLNGQSAGSVSWGCCKDQTNSMQAIVWACDTSHNTCKWQTNLNNGSLTVSCF